MGGGLLQLVSYGKEDDILITNPEITFFKLVYHKYTNFSLDTLQSTHTIGFGNHLQIPIPRTGELLYNLVIKLELPIVSVKYLDTDDEMIYKFISNQYYNYRIDNYNRNSSIIFNQNNLLNSELNINNFEYNIIEFFTYISPNGTLNKLYNIFESSNLMTIDQSTNIPIINSNYYKNRQILHKFTPLTTSNYTFLNNNFFNEFNYYMKEDELYIEKYDSNLKSYMHLLYFNHSYESTIINKLLKYNQQLFLNKESYLISTATTFYNDFKNRLFYQSMPNDYLRQAYMMTKYGYSHIDDIMLNLNVNGSLLLYGNNLNDIPNFLIFVDKTDQSIIIPIIITNIYNYTPATNIITTSTEYYSYTGYILNLDYMNNLIKQSVDINQYIIFKKVLIFTDDFLYEELDIKLQVYNITISKSTDNISFLYTIYIRTNNMQQIYNAISDCKYLIYIANNDGRIDYLNYSVPPTGLLLIDLDNPMIIDTQTNFLIIFCKNTQNTYDIKNLQILSPYIPILTNDNTLFTIIPNSTNTDYKLQLNYLITNNLDTNTALETVSNYPKLLFNVLNSFLNTITLSIKNTINSDLSINFDVQFNNDQLANYKTSLNINLSINNTLLDNINTNFLVYKNNLLNSYSYISASTNNSIIFNELINTYNLINLFTNQLTLLSYINSFDLTNIVSVVYNYNTYIYPTIIYNDFNLIQINTKMDLINTNLYKIRLYPNFIDDTITKIKDASNIIFNDINIDYIKVNNQLTTSINLIYNSDTYLYMYTYTIIHIIQIKSTYIEAYVRIDQTIYKNNVLSNDLISTIINNNNNITFIPNTKYSKYVLTSNTNNNVSYALLYSDEYPQTTGNTDINQQLVIVNYYLANKLTYSKFEEINALYNIYSNIYDIIPYPNYYYGKFNYDIKQDTTINLNNNNIFVHDIYIYILYNAYKNLLISYNSSISNIISYIIQDISLNITSYFKDQAFNLNNNTSKYELSASSLQKQSINASSYTSYKTTDYNLINILSNSLFLSVDHILNTTLDLTYRLDNLLLMEFQTNIIFKKLNITTILDNILTISTNNIYINTNLFIKYLSLTNTPTNILNYIKSLSNPFVDIIYDNLNNLSINSTIATNINNNIVIYDMVNNINISNKTKLLTIINQSKINYPESFNYTSLLNQISIQTGIYYNNLSFEQLFTIINNAIKNYIIIYIIRSDILDLNFNTYGTVDKNYILNLFISQITDFTNKTNIMNTLLFLQNYNYITSEIYFKMLNDLLNITSYSNYIVLSPDPLISDGYFIQNALSFYSASILFNNILNSSIDPIVSIYNNSPSINKQKLIDLLTNINLSQTPNTNNQNDSIFINNLLQTITKTNSITYGNLYNIINNGIKEYLLIYFSRSTILDYPILANSIYIKFIDRIDTTIGDFTQIEHIKNILYAFTVNIESEYPILRLYQYYNIIDDLLANIELSTINPKLDTYNIKDAISYVNGSYLIKIINNTFNNITDQILISSVSLFNTIDNYIILNSNLKYYYFNKLYLTNPNTTINLINATTNINNYVLSRYTNNNILYNMTIYNYTTDTDIINKQSLLTILKTFMLQLSINNEKFNIKSLFIDKFSLIFKNSIQYNDIFNIINDGIKNYFIIFLLRNMNQTLSCVNAFINHIIDYTNSINIINTLNYLVDNLIITIEQSTFIKLNVLNIKSINTVIQLNDDPIVSDNYSVVNALSFYSGNYLLNMITNDNNRIIFDIDNNINISNKSIILNIIKNFFINLGEYYDSNNLLYNLINDINGSFSTILNFNDIYNIINTAAKNYFKLRIKTINSDYTFDYNTIINYLDYTQIIEFIYSNNDNLNNVYSFDGVVSYSPVNLITRYVYPETFTIIKYANNNNALSLLNSSYLLYNIYTSHLLLYENGNYPIKNNILNILNLYKTTSPETFNYDDLIINKINNSNGEFFYKLLYNDLFTIINNAVYNYFNIYFKQNLTYIQTLTDFPTDFINNFNDSIAINKINNFYADYTTLMSAYDYTIRTLSELLTTNGKITEINNFYNKFINVQTYDQVYQLSDDYNTYNGLSPFTAISLLNAIFKFDNIKISKNSINNIITTIQLNTNDINIDTNLIVSSLFNTESTSIQSIIDTNITSSNTYNLLTKDSINNIINNLIIYNPDNDLYDFANSFILYPDGTGTTPFYNIEAYVNNKEILTYDLLIKNINNTAKSQILLILFRNPLLDTLQISRQNFMYLMMSRITDYTNFNNIINSLNYLEQTKIISTNDKTKIATLFIYESEYSYFNQNYIDNYTIKENFRNNFIFNCVYNLFKFSNTDILNIDIYNLNNNLIINKTKLLNILYTFKNNLSIESTEIYDIQTHIIDKIVNIDGTYYNSITYNNIHTIIKNAVLNYFIIYLIRLNNIPRTTNDIFYLTSNFENYSDIINNYDMLINIKNGNISNMINLIMKLTPITKYSDIINLPADPINSDGYSIKNALSYYRGVELLKNIIYRLTSDTTNIIKIPRSFFINGLNLNNPLNDKNLYIDKFLSPNDIINTESLVNSIYDSLIYLDSNTNDYGSNIFNIIYQLNNLNIIVDTTTTTNIINQLNILNFDSQVSIINNNYINIISLDSNLSVDITKTFINGDDNILSNRINSLSSYTIKYNFINELINSNMYLTDSTIINQIINIYINNKNLSIFTNDYMKSIVNLCNNASVNVINDYIINLTNIANQNNQTNYSNPINIKYNNVINYTDLSYFDKIFYLYNYIISSFYNNGVYFKTINDNELTNYTIFIDDSTNISFLGNPAYPFFGPTIRQIYIKSTITDYNTNYYVSVMLNNIYNIISYFSIIINDPINFQSPFTYNSINELGYIFQRYYSDVNIDINIINGLIIYIEKYSPNFNTNISQTIITTILNNKITNTIYSNINYFLFLLVHIVNNYILGDVINGSISTVESISYYISTINNINSNYQTIIIPNITTFTTSTYLTEITMNEFNKYFNGILQYNINNSAYNDFAKMINEQRLSHITLYTNILNLDNIGYDSKLVYDYFRNYLSFDFNNLITSTTNFRQISISDQLNINTSNFKTSISYINKININKIFSTFINITKYVKTNIALYTNNITYIDFINNNIDYNTYYSDISSFYNYIKNKFNPSTFITNIFSNILNKYILHDATTLNNNFIMQTYNFDILYIILKNAFINLNIQQIIDLNNFNYYYLNYNDDLLTVDFKNIIDTKYSGINSGCNYQIFTIDTISLIINNYYDNFFTTKLMQVDSLTTSLIIQQNTLISDKITDAYNTFNSLSIDERLNVYTIYNDKAQINHDLLYAFYTNSSYTNYIYYDIIMTNTEYTNIINGIYDFNKDSIGILIYDTITSNRIKLDSIPLPLNKQSELYTFKFYRKTDLPPEYKFIFDTTTTTKISDIKLNSNINDIFIDTYNELTIFDNEENIIINNDIIINENKFSLSFNNYLITESHKLIIINNEFIYRVSSIVNQTNYIYVNYPYELIHLINSIEIYGKLYLITELTILKLDNYTNISPLYKSNDIIQLQIKNNDLITITKNYINTTIKIYLNEINNNNLSSNYYIQNDQLYINARIIGYNQFSITTINLYDDISNLSINMIGFGLINLLCINTTELKSIPIINTEYTNYDILEYFNTNLLMSEILNYQTINNQITTIIRSKNSNFYRDLNQSLNVDSYINKIIKSITITTNNKSSLFLNKYPTLNLNNNFILDTTNIDHVNLTNKNILEINNLYNYNQLIDSIKNYFNKPPIPKFSYIPYLSDFIIQNITLLIDGEKVDEISDTYMYIYHQILISFNKKLAYYKLNPNNEKLLLETETKNPFTLFIEVPLYFSQISGLAFPLISNIYSNISININIRSLDNLIIKNKYATLKYTNKIKLTLIYSIVYLDEYECKLFNTMRHEYLYEKKIYNSPIKLDNSKSLQNKFHIPFDYPIKDMFYYIQLQSMIDNKQYYNFTNNFILPELNMSIRNKIKYIEQQINNNCYDPLIYDLYLKLCLMRDSKLRILSKTIILNDLSLLYNNLSKNDTNIINSYINAYYDTIYELKTITKSQLYLNSICRFNTNDSLTNKLIPYQSYTGMIPGLHVFTFSLHPLEYQPSGYCNFSALKPELQLTLNINFNINDYEIIRSYIIGRSYNIIRFMSGISGIAW